MRKLLFLLSYLTETSGQKISSKGRIARRAVIEDWMTPFSAYTAAETPN